MRIPWIERMAQQTKLEESRRRRAENHAYIENGPGDDFAVARNDSEAVLLPVRSRQSVIADVSIVPLTVSVQLSKSSRSDGQGRGLPQEEILSWQATLKGPTPTSSPGAMKEVARPENVRSRAAAQGPSQAVSRGSEAQSTKIEDWMDADQAAFPEDSEEEEGQLPVKNLAASPSDLTREAFEDVFLPIRLRQPVGERLTEIMEPVDDDGGDLPTRYYSQGNGVPQKRQFDLSAFRA